LRRLTLAEAEGILQAGGVILFPTETSYALGCMAHHGAAVARVVALKQRPEGKPLPIMLPSLKAFRRLPIETPLAVLAEHFWPGPLTLVVPAYPGLPPEITAATQMVGVRCSGHPLAQALLTLGPLVATSANRTGFPAVSTLEEADAAGLDGVDGILPGACTPGAASTVVSLKHGDLRIFREGLISVAELRSVWEPSRAY
jgi:L-threonylcarbamoyladenylate synthase